MDNAWRTIIWQQFGAAIDMFDNALAACPDELWLARLWDHPSERPEYAQFWYLAYHTLFWLDYYLSGGAQDFAPPAPYNLDELDPAGLVPDRPYTRDELRDYLRHCRRKCQATLETLADEQARRLYKFGWGEVSFAELCLYNMRHVQEHGAQLSLLLGQRAAAMPSWVGRAKRVTG